VKIRLFYISTFMLIIFLRELPCKAQAQDSTRKIFKNTVHVNISNPMLFGDKYIVVGYERVIKNYQTLSINLGQFSLPKFGSTTDASIQLQKDYHDKGYHVSAEYRIYLKKENKYTAPRGIYIGPYYAYNYFERENQWHLNTADYTGDLTTNLSLSMNFIGAQLGYQFVFWKRISLDMIFMGPGIWFYNFKTKLNTTLSPEDEALLFQKLNDILNDKFPGYSFAINSSNFQKTGSVNTSSVGMRILINLGFRF
jgi:hypothetical protein